MAKSIVEKITDQAIGMITRDLTKTALINVKKIFAEKKKSAKSLRKKDQDAEKDLEP